MIQWQLQWKQHHSTLGCSFVPRFTVALLKRSLLSPPPFMSTTFCACFWKHASFSGSSYPRRYCTHTVASLETVSWCRYGCMSSRPTLTIQKTLNSRIRKLYCPSQKWWLYAMVTLLSIDYYTHYKRARERIVSHTHSKHKVYLRLAKKYPHWKKYFTDLFKYLYLDTRYSI